VNPSHTITSAPEPPSAPGAGQPHLFLVLRCDKPLEPGARFCLDGIDAVTIGRSDSFSIDRHEDGGATLLRIGIPDPRMSSSHAQLQKVLGAWIVRDAGSKNGTWVDGRRVTNMPLDDGALLELGHSFLLYRSALPVSGTEILDGREVRPAAYGLATLSPAFRSQLDRVELVARSRVPVLLLGETGTGKELIARAVHELSGRAGPFLAVNCGALPENLVESELFGYRKGAFSGASDDRPGLVRSSDKGTLLLDEIGSLPLPAQAALLRVLQEAEVVPVGATRPLAVDLRVVAATHEDLGMLASRGRFRPDLLARLSGFTVVLPPLRERREDLGLLLAALLRKLAGDAPQEVTFTAAAARVLLLHLWPLNVRELEKCLSTALVLARDGRVDVEHLPADMRKPRNERPGAPDPLDEPRHGQAELVALLREHGGNVTAVARALGKRRTQVQRWLRRLRIDALSFRR
jgi:sigma-54 dependent transcriptional regulator, acetoin dehydrogenase operon transcriptional activator AcoR